MKIAIHAADLDHDRIDGARVYLLNMLRNFGALDRSDSFLIYHGSRFNPRLAPPTFPNYSVKSIPCAFLWTQTRLALELFRDAPDVLWMPVHNVPLLRRKNLKVVVTIHDLAFKIFPGYFTAKDLAKLNQLGDMAIKNADRIIAISHSTKNDILRFFPQIPAERITVIHHGFDTELFQKDIPSIESESLLKSYKLEAKNYILYVGAIQPRKNLGVLVEAFEKIKERNPALKLVIAGAPAWKSEGTLRKIAASRFSADIIVTGTLGFEKLPALYRSAKMFVFPAIYEGFGIPVLEAMASGTPVVCARNSSLTEAGGEAALYFKTEDSAELALCMGRVIQDGNLAAELVRKGLEHVKNFSWKKCAKETLSMFTFPVQK
jgi:glycosyltransferase involved in cell wall biosynthesis